MALLSVEEVAWKLFTTAKNGAPRRNKAFDLRYEDVLTLVKEGRCAMSGIPFDMNEREFGGPELPWRASLDRIDNSVGYLRGNIQVTSKIYNTAKYTFTDEDVLRLARALVQRNGA
ncbi:MAG: hypothetical protein ACK515_17845 [bacterium]|jgi:hypothetical protein